MALALYLRSRGPPSKGIFSFSVASVARSLLMDLPLAKFENLKKGKEAVRRQQPMINLHSIENLAFVLRFDHHLPQGDILAQFHDATVHCAPMLLRSQDGLRLGFKTFIVRHFEVEEWSRERGTANLTLLLDVAAHFEQKFFVL